MRQQHGQKAPTGLRTPESENQSSGMTEIRLMPLDPAEADAEAAAAERLAGERLAQTDRLARSLAGLPVRGESAQGEALEARSVQTQGRPAPAELPVISIDDEATLDAELAEDLRRLRQASESLASTWVWVEGIPAGESQAAREPRTAVRDGEAATSKDGIQSGEGPRPTGFADAPAMTRHQTYHAEQGCSGPVMPDDRARDPASHDEELPRLMNDDAFQNESSLTTTQDLEAELKRARAALTGLREQAERQARLYGSVNAQRRKLEHRAEELRQRVAKAQEALNERARKLQAALAEEREKLRAYHAKLQAKARELSESSERRKTRLAEEVAAERARLEADRAALRRREAEIEARLAAADTADGQAVAKREAELQQKTRARLAEIDRGATVREATLEAAEKALARRQAEVEQTEEAVARRRDDCDAAEEAVKQRDAELRAEQEALAERESELAATRQALDQRQAELDARAQEVDKLRLAGEDAIRARAEKLAEKSQEEQVRVAREAAALRKQLEDQSARREAELAELHDMLQQREAKLAEREEEMRVFEQEAEQRRHGIEKRSTDLKRRDEELARLSAAMEVRERRVQEWQTRLEKTEARQGASREELEKQLRAVEQAAEENRELSSTLASQTEAMQERQADIAAKHEEVERKLTGLREKENALQARLNEAERIHHALQGQAEQVVQERKRLAELEQRSTEVERRAAGVASRVAEVFQREEALKQRVAEHQRDVEQVKREHAELAELRQELEATHGESRQREVGLAERTARIEQLELQMQRRVEEQAREREEFERQLAAEQATIDQQRAEFEAERQAERAKIEQSRQELLDELAEQRTSFEERQRAERDRLEKMQAEQAEESARFEKERERLSKLQTLNDEGQLALQMDREQLREDEQAFDEARRDLQREREHFAREQETLVAAQTRLEQQAADIARDKDELTVARAAIETERARSERDRLALRDRERVLAEEKTEAQAARNEAERLRQEVARRFEQADELRRQLLEKAARLKARKDQLIQDAAKIEAGLGALETESAEVIRQRQACEEDRRQVEEERQRLSADRAKHERERNEQEQARKTFQAGLRSLEEARRDLADREARLAERADELEAFRNRLEAEYGGLRHQRQELLDLHPGDDATKKIEALVTQMEAREAELRRREEVLNAHGQALSARATELSRAEDELGRRRREHESRSGEVVRQAEALEARRREFESLLQSERTRLDEIRRQAKAELADQQADLQQQRRELEERRAESDRQAAERETAAVQEAEPADHAWYAEARSRVETELADRLADLARQEEQLERRCKARVEELDRDIQQRLAELEGEIRDRREQAARELEARRRAHEEEMRKARGRLDEQVEDLRLRQAAAAAEQSLLREQRRDLDERMQTSQWQGPRVAARLETAEQQDTTEGVTTADEATVAAEVVAAGDMFEDPSAEPSRDFPSATSSGDERASQAQSEVEPQETVPSISSSEEIGKDAALAPVIGQSGRRQDIPDRRPRRFRPILVGVGAAVFGMAAGGIFLLASPPEVEVAASLSSISTETAPALTAAEHAARMTQSEVLVRASQLANADLAALFHQERKIKLTMHEQQPAVLLSVRAPAVELAAAQGWIDAWARAYEESLCESEVSDAQRSREIADLQAAKQELLDRRDAARQELEKLTAAMTGDRRFSDVESARTAKGELRSKLAEVKSRLDAAREGLAKFENQPPPADPIAPTEEQISQACAADAELVQAVKQRDAKAREFHQALTEAMSRTQIPLATMLTTISTLDLEVQDILKEQADPELRQELEQIAVDLNEYRSQAEALSKSWDEVAPKVSAWKSGGDPELLIEYQTKAEMLVREFHGQSRQSFGATAQKADAIGRGGSEPTKRRVVQSRLLKAANACLEARNDWIIAARGLVPRHNVQLRDLRSSIRDLAPRIEQRRQHHQQKLAEHLLQVRADERTAELQSLRNAEQEAEREYQKLGDEFVRLDYAGTLDPVLSAELQRLRDQVLQGQQVIADLDQRAAERQAAIERLQTAPHISLAGTVHYQVLPPLQPSWLDEKRLHRALGLGGAAAGLFVCGSFLLSGLRGRRRPAV